MQPLTARFKNYLAGQTAPKLKTATLNNYVSDAEVFLNWLGRQLQEDQITPAQLSAVSFNDYGRWLNQPSSQISPATAERYYSSLKRFGEFLLAEKLSNTNPAAGLKPSAIQPTLEQVLNDFKAALKQQNLSASTIKNYLSDVNQYLLWTKNNLKITDSISI